MNIAKLIAVSRSNAFRFNILKIVDSSIFNSICLLFPDDRKKRKFNLERVGQYLQNQNLQKLSRISITSDWNRLLEQNECLKNSSYIYPHHKNLSLVQEHNNLKESVRKLFEKPDTLISLKLQLIYTVDICDVTSRSSFNWHQFDLDEKGSTLFSFTVNNSQMYLKEFIPRSECVKFAKFEFAEEEEEEDEEEEDEDGDDETEADDETKSELSRKFPQMKMLHTQFYNDKSISMLFAYKKDKPTANCFVQFPIQPLLSRLTSARIQRRIIIDPALDAVNLRELMDIDLVRPLDISDGCSLAVSGGRKIATIISASRKKFYHFEMEVDEGDYDDDDNDGSDNENAENENDAMGLNNTNDWWHNGVSSRMSMYTWWINKFKRLWTEIFVYLFLEHYDGVCTIYKYHDHINMVVKEIVIEISHRMLNSLF